MSTPYQMPPDIQQWVDAHLNAGAYKSTDEVFRDAMNALDELDREKLRLFEVGNRIAEEQSRLGLSKPLNLAAVLERVEQRVTSRGNG
jgi:Arc/MetJ-type ribon-helix-helix transcriptional regulator